MTTKVRATAASRRQPAVFWSGTTLGALVREGEGVVRRPGAEAQA